LGDRFVYEDTVGESELCIWTESFFELCRSPSVSVGSAGRIRRNLTAKLVTDLSRRLGFFFLGLFLFFALVRGMKIRHRTLDVRTRRFPFLGRLAFRIGAARALQPGYKRAPRWLTEMRQLMRQYFLTGAGLRRILTGA